MYGKLFIAFIAWLGIVFCATFRMLQYDFTPGLILRSKSPATVSGSKSGSRGVMRVFLHPQCDCSQATVEALRTVLKNSDQAVETTFYFYTPKGAPKDWNRTKLWDEAAEFKGSHIVSDVDGTIARRSGAYTSGTVQLIDRATGKFVFQGGITPGRGQEGDCLGAESIRSYLLGKRGVESAPVFGCAIIPGELL